MKTWHYLREIIRPRKGFFLLISGLRILAHLMAVHGVGLLTRAFFDRLTGQGAALFRIETIAALMITIEIVRRLIHIYTHLRVVEWNYYSGTLLRANLFEHILARPGAQSLPGSAGEAVSRLRDDTLQIALFTGTSFQRLLSHYTFGIIAAIILLRINAQITLFVFLPLMLVMIVANLARKRITHYRQESQQAMSNVTGFIGDIFGMVLAVKVAGAEKRIVDYFRRLNQTRRAATLKARLFDETLSAIFYNANTVGAGVILLLAGQAMQAGTFSVGDFALFVYYLNFVGDMISGTGSTLNQYRQTQVSLNRLEPLLQGAPPATLVKRVPIYLQNELPTVPYQAKTESHRLDSVAAKQLSYHYPTSGSGIHNISFTLKRGTFTVITGRVGSGKTTLLRVLLGLLPKEHGEIYWNGAFVDDPATFFVPPHAAYVSQVPLLFSDTLRDNILLGLPEEKVNLAKAIHTAILDPDIATFTKGLQTTIGPKGIKLSGGQVQRTAAARAFVADTELLVLDDLSSALDVNTELALWEKLFTSAERTYLVVSHRPIVLQRADHIILLKDGQIDSEGTLNSLLKHSTEMNWLWQGVQKGKEIGRGEMGDL